MLFSKTILSQENSIAGADLNTCQGFLVDSGLSAANYGNNENQVITICASAPETIINLYWNIFNLGTGDAIEIFDGNSIASPLIGSYTLTALQTTDVTSTGATGCLTVRFTSDGSNVGNFGAEISCGLPCERPLSVITSAEDPMPLLICPGEAVTFDASNTVFYNGTQIQTFEWIFDDGATDVSNWPMVTHTFIEPGGYKVQLAIVDDNNCNNNNVNDYIVFVSTPPIFDLVTEITDICLGGEAFLGITNIAQDSTYYLDSLNNWISEPWIDIPNADLGGDFCIPDDQSGCFHNEISISAFSYNEVLDEVSDIESFFINFEHSFMGDLSITFICPNNQSINVHQQGGGGTYLGVPIDDIGGDSCPVPLGVGWDYWWAPSATNGTWQAEAGATSLPSGTYQSVDPWTNLLGCPLNGTWEIEICDLWGLDDGNIFTWNINFNPELYDNLLSFEPIYGPDCDSTFWVGDGIISQSSGCDWINVVLDLPGVYDYTYYATNNFGCTYDTTVSISVDVAPTINAGPDITLDCTNSNQQLAGAFNEPVPPGTSFIWQWTPALGLATPSLQYTEFDNIPFTTNYTLTGYPVGQPGCFSTDDILVTVNSGVSIDVEEFYTACHGDSIHVLAPTISGGTQHFEFFWESYEGEIITDYDFYLAVIEPMEYCAIITDLCNTTDTACTSVTTYPIVPATFHVEDPFGCEPHYSLMTLDYQEFQNIESMTWHFGDGETATTLASANHEYHIADTYHPWLDIIDINGCFTSDTLESSVIIWPTPIASFSTSPEIAELPNTNFEFNNESNNGEDYHWTFTYLGQAYTEDAEFTFPLERPNSYLVWLYASTQYGCIDSTSRQVEVKQAIDVYIPNAFTPDYDGINDLWQIHGTGFEYEGFKAQVFDRWGGLIYESSDPFGAWTGAALNGSYFVPDGAYNYRVIIRDSQNDVNHEFTGSVVLVR